MIGYGLPRIRHSGRDLFFGNCEQRLSVTTLLIRKIFLIFIFTVQYNCHSLLILFFHLIGLLITPQYLGKIRKTEVDKMFY